MLLAVPGQRYWENASGVGSLRTSCFLKLRRVKPEAIATLCLRLFQRQRSRRSKYPSFHSSKVGFMANEQATYSTNARAVFTHMVGSAIKTAKAAIMDT